MENDSIRSAGRDTLVDIWVDGKVRQICISNEAIGAFVGFDEAARMSERDRCEFVRTNLHLLVTAVKARLRDDGAADTLVLEAGHFPRSDGLSGDRRKAEQRKRERRQGDGPKPGQAERRRGDRRQGERRARASKRD